MSNIEKKYLRAIQYAHRAGFGQIADDFGGYYVERLLLGKGLTQPFKYALIDFLRQHNGNPRTLSQGADALLQTHRTLGEERTMDKAVAHTYQESKLHNLDFQKALKKLSERERAMLILYSIYGLDLKEIGYCFGVSEATVSLVMKESKRVIARVMNAQ